MPLVHQARLIIGGLNGKSAPAHASRTYALSIGLGGQANRMAQRAAGATNGGGLAAGLMKAVIRSEITPDRAARMAYQTIDPIQPEKLKLIVPITAGSTSVTNTPAATRIMNFQFTASAPKFGALTSC